MLIRRVRPVLPFSESGGIGRETGAGFEEELPQSPPMDRSDAQTASVDFSAQAYFLLLRRFPQKPVAVAQTDVCRDLLPNVLVECENAVIGQDLYAHDRPRPEQS